MSEDLTIQDVARRTALSVATLRAWERRYGFPVPRRRASGHRRYGEEDVAALLTVQRERAAGLSLPVAIERAREAVEEGATSLFVALQQARPDALVHTFRKSSLIAISHAIEDEVGVRASRPVLFASFQERRFYAPARDRWRYLNRTAAACVVFADFPKAASRAGQPIEVPIPARDPLRREWVLVCDADRYTACLTARELEVEPREERRFETLWTVEPDVVRAAARLAAARMLALAPDLAPPALDVLEQHTPPAPRELRNAAALTSRIISYMEP